MKEIALFFNEFNNYFLTLTDLYSDFINFEIEINEKKNKGETLTEDDLDKAKEYSYILRKYTSKTYILFRTIYKTFYNTENKKVNDIIKNINSNIFVNSDYINSFLDEVGLLVYSKLIQDILKFNQDILYKQEGTQNVQD